MRKVMLLYGETPWKSEWQKKSFKDDTAAMEFIRRHRKNIHGINYVKRNVSSLSHFEIAELIRGDI